MLTGNKMQLYNLLRVEKALRMEIDHGLKGRQPLVKLCQMAGFQGKTKKKALEWVLQQQSLLKESMQQKHLI